MSRFFCVMSDRGVINDNIISNSTTYSSYELNQLLTTLAGNIFGCYFKEYPPNIRIDSQDIFETPNSDNSVMWVLREGVKMTEEVDYIVADSMHIKFLQPVKPKYSVSIFVSGKKEILINGKTNIAPALYTQKEPAALWKVEHKLGFKYPRVVLVDSNDMAIQADIYYRDENNCEINFTTECSGKCICSI